MTNESYYDILWTITNIVLCFGIFIMKSIWEGYYEASNCFIFGGELMCFVCRILRRPDGYGAHVYDAPDGYDSAAGDDCARMGL